MTQFATEFSLWLRPSQDQIDEIIKIISELSHRFNTIPFPPHITLLPGLSCELDILTQACEEIIDQMPSFEIPMNEIAFTTKFYQNFFIKAQPTTTLIDLRNTMMAKLKYSIDEAYMPHISLLYGNLDVKIKKKLKTDYENSYSKIFYCERLDIYNTKDKIADWFLVNSYQFSRSKR